MTWRFLATSHWIQKKWQHSFKEVMKSWCYLLSNVLIWTWSSILWHMVPLCGLYFHFVAGNFILWHGRMKFLILPCYWNLFGRGELRIFILPCGFFLFWHGELRKFILPCSLVWFWRGELRNFNLPCILNLFWAWSHAKHNFIVPSKLSFSMFKFNIIVCHEDVQSCRHVNNSNLNLPCTSRKKATW